MQLERETALIHAILFLESDPVDVKSLVRISGLAQHVVTECLDQLQKSLQAEDQGLELIHISEGVMLSPKRELWEVLKHRYGRRQEGRLSRAALETLSIIAYSQPITRAEIENLRGVSADGMIRLLLSKKLIKEVGKKDAPGKPVQYGTTREFLSFFRLSSISELPKMDEVDERRFQREDEGE
jgi:segregation and condensation protein B